MKAIKKITALTLALAMILTFTPLYGAWGASYAEDEGTDPVLLEAAGEEIAPDAEQPAAGEEQPADSAEEAEETEEEASGAEVPSADSAYAADADSAEAADAEEAAPEEAAGVKMQRPAAKAPASEPEDGEGDDPFPFPVFDLEQIDGQLGDRENLLYDTTAITYRIPDEAINSDDSVTEIIPFVGLPEVQLPDGGWTELTGCYTYNATEHTITVDGAKAGAAIDAMFPDPEWLPDQIGISFRAVDAEGNDRWIAGTVAQFRYTYIGMEEALQGDRTVLPGWDGTFDGERMVWVEDRDHPDGEDVPIEINDVTVKDGGDLLEEFHEDSDDEGNRWWYYRAGRQGTVTFEVTYTDIEGVPQKYDAHLFISGDVYECGIYSEGDIYRGLPGSEIVLHANAGHKIWNGDGEDYTEDGLEFDWEIVRGQDFGTLTPVKGESGKYDTAVIKFREMEEGADGMQGGVRVKLTVRDTLSEDPEEEKVSEFAWVELNSDFYTIWPTGLNPFLVLGETQKETFTLRHYRYNGSAEEGYNDEGFKEEEITRLRFNFDENALEISGEGIGNISDGEEVSGCNTFSFTRISDGGTNIWLNVWFTEEGGEEREEGFDYWFAGQNYDMWFDEHDIEVYSDAEEDPELRLNTGNFGRGEEADEFFNFTVTAGIWEDEEWVEVFPEENYTVTRDGDDLVIRYDRSKIDFDEYWDIRIEVRAVSKSIEWTRDCDAWLHLREACDHHLWLSSAPEYEDCYSTGIKRQMCWNCGERKIVEVPARGHVAKAVKAKAAKAAKEGNVAYYTCAECGKCFSDKGCTKEVTADSRIIPKGTTISTLAAASKGFTATWKKPTGDYLKHTSGYELTYALDSKFKKSVKTVTIKKGATVTKKVTKLKAKTKYYVKVRAYRTIDGKKYYSPWSKVKNVTTK